MVVGSDVRIPRGLKIVCPRCLKVIGEVLKDLRAGDVIDENCIKIYGVKLKKGDALECPRCKFPVAIDTRMGAFIYTDKGWMPSGKPIGIPTDIMLFLLRVGIL